MDNYIGEIRTFGFGFAPKGWATCDGQLMPISQNTALFSILGTQYGGDGKSNFALPNLRGSVAIGQGQGPGLSYYAPGEAGGTPAVTLNTQEIAGHNHNLEVSERPAVEADPGGRLLAVSANAGMYNTVSQPTVVLDPANAIGPTGGNLAHNNLMPYLTLTFCIALQGIFPPRGGLGASVMMKVSAPGAELVAHPAPAEDVPPPGDRTEIVFGPEQPTAEPGPAEHGDDRSTHEEATLPGPAQVTVTIATSSQQIQDVNQLPSPQPPKIALNGVLLPAPEENLWFPCGVQVVVIDSSRDITDPASIISNRWQFLGQQDGAWEPIYRNMWEAVASQILSSGDPQQQLVLVASFGLDVDAQPTPAALEQLLGLGAGAQLQTWGAMAPVSEGGYFIEYPANYVLVGNSGYGYGEATEQFDYSSDGSRVTASVTVTLENPGG